MKRYNPVMLGSPACQARDDLDGGRCCCSTELSNAFPDPSHMPPQTLWKEGTQDRVKSKTDLTPLGRVITWEGVFTL